MGSEALRAFRGPCFCGLILGEHSFPWELPPACPRPHVHLPPAKSEGGQVGTQGRGGAGPEPPQLEPSLVPPASPLGCCSHQLPSPGWAPGVGDSPSPRLPGASCGFIEKRAERGKPQGLQPRECHPLTCGFWEMLILA